MSERPVFIEPPLMGIIPTRGSISARVTKSDKEFWHPLYLPIEIRCREENRGWLGALSTVRQRFGLSEISLFDIPVEGEV